jgi:hypothetical protein
MQIICSWCEKSIEEKEPLGDKSISHSICEGCYKKIGYEIKGFKDRLGRALQIAKREWGNIRVSLEMCGDIGEFDSNNYVDINPNLLSEGSVLVRNLIEMENKLPTYGYFTQEASYVFTSLASKAAERLGLIGGMAQTFGRGYSWIRTGWFDSVGIEEQHLIKQVIFFKLFFPLGRDFISWDFNSQMVKKKLSLVFYKFITWQGNPSIYIQDVRDYKDQLEPLWHGLLLAFGFPVADRAKKNQKSL